MSIYSSPYPYDGEERCPTVITAENIVRIAVLIDGRDVLGNDFQEMIEWDRVDEVAELSRLKSGLGIGRVRKGVALLWRRMSKRAKANYFQIQYSNAITYLDECMDNIRNEFGEVEAPCPLPLPSPNEILGQWLR
ncbi:MAG TPA: hypothetical protein VH643_24970 [Gemmataceae bacterium]